MWKRRVKSSTVLPLLYGNKHGTWDRMPRLTKKADNYYRDTHYLGLRFRGLKTQIAQRKPEDVELALLVYCSGVSEAQQSAPVMTSRRKERTIRLDNEAECAVNNFAANCCGGGGYIVREVMRGLGTGAQECEHQVMSEEQYRRTLCASNIRK